MGVRLRVKMDFFAARWQDQTVELLTQAVIGTVFALLICCDGWCRQRSQQLSVLPEQLFCSSFNAQAPSSNFYTDMPLHQRQQMQKRLQLGNLILKFTMDFNHLHLHQGSDSRRRRLHLPELGWKLPPVIRIEPRWRSMVSSSLEAHHSFQ